MRSGDTKCSHCGETLSDSHAGPCPNCGKAGKKVSVSITDGAVVSDSLGWETRKEYYEKNRSVLISVITITILAPFLGLFIAGGYGVVIGLVIGGFLYFLGPRAIIKVREIRSG